MWAAVGSEVRLQVVSAEKRAAGGKAGTDHGRHGPDPCGFEDVPREWRRLREAVSAGDDSGEQTEQLLALVAEQRAEGDLVAAFGRHDGEIPGRGHDRHTTHEGPFPADRWRQVGS